MTDHAKGDCLHCRIREMVLERFNGIDQSNQIACDAAFNETICQVAEAVVALLSDVPAESREAWLAQFAGAMENAWSHYIAGTLQIRTVTTPRRLH